MCLWHCGIACNCWFRFSAVLLLVVDLVWFDDLAMHWLTGWFVLILAFFVWLGLLVFVDLSLLVVYYVVWIVWYDFGDYGWFWVVFVVLLLCAVYFRFVSASRLYVGYSVWVSLLFL